MTPPSPESVAAAVERCKLRLKTRHSEQQFLCVDIQTILTALAAQSEELAQARKVLLEYANPANWIERMGGRGDFEGYDYKPQASGHPCDEASAAMQQEQKTTPSEGPAPAPTSQ